MTLEFWISMSVMVGFFGLLVGLYVSHGRGLTLAPFPIGLYRRLRDRVWRRNIIAAAQAMTLAGEPKRATEMLGRYGIDLCPRCGQWTPIPSRLWARLAADHLTYEHYVFVQVCHKCHESACPAGWVVMKDRPESVQFQATIRRIQRRTDVRMHQAFERAQLAMANAQERFSRMRARFDKRMADFRRRAR